MHSIFIFQYINKLFLTVNWRVFNNLIKQKAKRFSDFSTAIAQGNKDIINSVCNFYKVSKAELLSKKKTKEVALARQVGMFLVLDMMSLPQLTVGKIFSRDHATVIYARDKIAEQMDTDTKLANAVSDIKKLLLKE